MNLYLAKSMELLSKVGYKIENSDITLEAIGHQYEVPPQRIYETIKLAAIVIDNQSVGSIALPESLQPGTGNLTLADFCTQFNLNMKLVIRELKKQGIEASEDLTIK